MKKVLYINNSLLQFLNLNVIRNFKINIREDGLNELLNQGCVIRIHLESFSPRFQPFLIQNILWHLSSRQVYITIPTSLNIVRPIIIVSYVLHKKHLIMVQ